MAEANRKLSVEVVAELKSDYSKLLEEISNDSDLQLEIRQKNQVFIYYKKNKILEIKAKSLDVNPKWKGPPPENAKDNPTDYFKEMKACINNWLNEKINKQEFETQQNIASANSSSDSEYIIIDMEYGPSQKTIEKEKRIKRPYFDLLGIKKTGEIILFEVKKGIGALEGKAGIDKHIEDFEKCFIDKEYKEKFSKILEEDIKGIIESKEKLGFLKLSEEFKNKIKYEEIKFMFIFEPSDDKNQEDELKEYKKQASEKYPTIFVKPNDYILRCPT
jgi:dGTP triphosphohydrolase